MNESECRREDIQITRIDDPMDPRVLEFCKEVCLENGAHPNVWGSQLDRKEIAKRFRMLEDSAIEEIWKFSLRKWSATDFDNLEVLMWRDKVIGVSGCRQYKERLLRSSMHLYTLKRFRHVCRNFQFAEDGLFARHLAYAKDLGSIDAIFITVYAHNSTLEAHVKNLGQRRLHAEGKGMHYIYDLQPWPEKIIFHEVPQNFFFYPLVGNFKFDGLAPEPLRKI